MTEEELIEAFKGATNALLSRGAEQGLHPIHMANLLTLTAIEIAVACHGVEATRSGLMLAASQVGADARETMQ